LALAERFESGCRKSNIGTSQQPAISLLPLESPPSRRFHFLRIFLYVLVFLYLAGSVLVGIGLGWMAMHPFRHPISQGEERNARAAAQRQGVEFRDAEITTADGSILRAWFMRPPSANGNVVILLHGVSDNRMGVYGYGQWLLQNHYMVLLPDARAHGSSGGEIASYGIKESDDVHRWVEWV
jgi:hypothetical protein